MVRCVIGMNPIERFPRFRITSPLLSGVVNAFIWLCIGAVVTSLIVTMTNMTEQSLTRAAYIIHGIACACGGFSSGKRSGSKGWYHGLLLGILYTVLVVLVGFLGFDAGLGPDTAILFGSAVAAGVLGGMVGVNAKK